MDQWDWERVITREMRTLRFLQDTVRDIVRCISDTSLLAQRPYPRLRTQLSDEVTFLSAQELLDLYPDLPCQGAGKRLCPGTPGHVSDGHRP